MLTEVLLKYNKDLLSRGLYRQRWLSPVCENMINFSSNDYLSLASDPYIKKAYQRGFKQYPVGSGGSMVVCGYHNVHHELEKAFMDALGVDACLLFPSGYAANLSVLSLLGRLNIHAFVDKAAHASIYDGIKLSGVHYTRFLHNDLSDLTKKIPHYDLAAILTEGIFSMSGQYAPLKEMAHLQPELIVDEAHAIGILGKEGLGAVVHHQLTQNEVPLRIIPLGKAFAAFGAIVAGQGVWVEALIQTARPHIYSTAISPAYASGLIKTLEVIRYAEDRRKQLFEMVNYFRNAIANSTLSWRDSFSPIQQLHLGCPHRALACATFLRENGIYCVPMRQPTVNKKDTGLRIVLNYHHQPQQIDYLFECLNNYVNSHFYSRAR